MSNFKQITSKTKPAILFQQFHIHYEIGCSTYALYAQMSADLCVTRFSVFQCHALTTCMHIKVAVLHWANTHSTVTSNLTQKSLTSHLTTWLKISFCKRSIALQQLLYMLPSVGPVVCHHSTALLCSVAASYMYKLQKHTKIKFLLTCTINQFL